ncbi:MAG: LuxR C-terminal-related transcriptional regulator [Thermoleophilia bacterium]
MALSQYQIETIFVQSRRALEYLPPDNLPSRFRASWALAFAYHFRGERAEAGRACAEALSIAEASGNVLSVILATTLLGQIQELDTRLQSAAKTFRRCLELLGDHYLPPSAGEAYRGLACICYEWNDLDAAERHGQKSLRLSRQYDRVIDRFIISEVFLARLKLARGDTDGAAVMLAEADQSVRRHNFVHRIPGVAAAQVLTLLRRGDVAAAAHLAQTHDLPISQARVHLAQGDTSEALAVLGPYRRQVEVKNWEDERLRVMVLQAVVLSVRGETDAAVRQLGEALALAEPNGFVRTFVDEGAPMARLLSAAAGHGVLPGYTVKLLAAFAAEEERGRDRTRVPAATRAQPLDEPLSPRELEVLRLIAQGLSNQDIRRRLFLALSTVKGHNQAIFGKLQVRRRTAAVARARELGLL